MRLEERTMKVYTRGEVLDNLKQGQRAIQVEGPNIGLYLYVSRGNELCMNNTKVVFTFDEANVKAKYIIVES